MGFFVFKHNLYCRKSEIRAIILTGDEFVNYGVLQTELYKSEYEMGIIGNGDEAILMNVQTYNIYYCHRNIK